MGREEDHHCWHEDGWVPMHFRLRVQPSCPSSQLPGQPYTTARLVEALEEKYFDAFGKVELRMTWGWMEEGAHLGSRMGGMKLFALTLALEN